MVNAEDCPVGINSNTRIPDQAKGVSNGSFTALKPSHRNSSSQYGTDADDISLRIFRSPDAKVVSGKGMLLGIAEAILFYAGKNKQAGLQNYEAEEKALGISLRSSNLQAKKITQPKYDINAASAGLYQVSKWLYEHQPFKEFEAIVKARGVNLARIEGSKLENPGLGQTNITS